MVLEGKPHASLLQLRRGEHDALHDVSKRLCSVRALWTRAKVNRGQARAQSLSAANGFDEYA